MHIHVKVLFFTPLHGSWCSCVVFIEHKSLARLTRERKEADILPQGVFHFFLFGAYAVIVCTAGCGKFNTERLLVFPVASGASDI